MTMQIGSGTNKSISPLVDDPAQAAAPNPELVRMKRRATGVGTMVANEGQTALEAMGLDKLLQSGLNVSLSPSEQRFIDGLSSSEREGLRSIAGAVVTAARESTPPRVRVPDALQSQWADFVSGGSAQSVDINALVQFVLRESYLQSTQDLYMYAEKVRFYNNVKEAIRNEMKRARDTMIGYAGQDEAAELKPPFIPNPIDDTFMGGSEMFQDDGAANAMAAVEAAQTDLEQNTSGHGVHQLTDEEKAALNPPAMGDVFFTLDEAGNPAHRIDFQGNTVVIYGPPGVDGSFQAMTTIWGDPHVNEMGDAGDDWHFGNDSTFILPDGSKLSLNTSEVSPGVFVTIGIDILSGNQRGYAGASLKGGNGAGVSDDRVEFDVEFGDSMGVDGGVFGLQANGEWAMLGPDGQFRDITEKSYGEFLQDGKVLTDGAPVAMSEAALLAAKDHLGGFVQNFDAALAQAEKYGVCKTKGELEAHLQNLEERLNSVGDDAQLANVDLQNILQKQQQTMQMMSNISKMLHDTALAVLRKIGG